MNCRMSRMREAKEFEGLQLAFPFSFPARFGIPPELDPARLFRVQLKSELPQPSRSDDDADSPLFMRLF